MFARRGAVRCDGSCPYLRRGARTRWPFHDRRRAHAARLAKVSRVKWARDVTQVPRDPDSSVGDGLRRPSQDGDRDLGELVNESPPRRLNPFLADLTQAMRSAAEAARLEAIEGRRNDAKAYVDEIQARTADEAGALRLDSEADVTTIRARAKAQADQVRVETQERIARRQQLLGQELADYNSTVELEVGRVQERVAAFQDEVGRFFEALQGADPLVFANMASKMPSPPEFDVKRESSVTEPEKVDPEIAGQPRAEMAPADAPAAPAGAPAAPAGGPPVPAVAQVAPARVPLLPGTLSGAGAVRGRLYSEWYGEVERLRESGHDDDALALLLDMVAATEAEARAEGSAVAPSAYESLAAIYRGRGDADAEQSLLERFARQEHGPSVATSRLLERRAALKKSNRR